MAYREQVEQLFIDGANMVDKQQFISLYSRARGRILTAPSIKLEWSKTCLCLFCPQRQYVQKMANAAQRLLANCALRPDKNQMMFEQNNEGSCRDQLDTERHRR